MRRTDYSGRFCGTSRNVRHTRKKGRSEKGLGTLQQRGRLWYFRITIDGKEYTHPTKTADLEQARLERDRFLRTIRPTASLAPLHETVTVAELVDDYVAVKKDNHQRSADDIERALKVNVLRAEMFQGRLAASITTQDLKNYREIRKAIGRKMRPSITNSRICGAPFSMVRSRHRRKS